MKAIDIINGLFATAMERDYSRSCDTCKAGDPEAEVTAEVLGLRPCSSDVPADRLAALTALATDVIREVLPQQEIVTEASSTDCNIPLSLGIPAVCFGLCESRGAHTAEDRVLISSLETGLRVGAALMARFFRLL